jgi:multiple sugar transport system ATP-binding protein
MAAIALQGVSKTFGATAVIHDVNLHIEDGEFCVLVGPSGSGKSTLLRMIAGLEALSSGRMHIGERDVTHLAPKDRDIAMVFQSYALYPQMTVRENMGFGLKLLKRPADEIRRRVDEAAAMLELGALMDRRPAALSGGQRQRVAMGRAMVRQPAVFLFDEPLSNLDAALRASVRSEIRAMHARTRTTSVYVTHDQVEAMTMGERIVVLRGGRVEQAGTPVELYEQPANRFVAHFIGSPAMNFIELPIQRSGNAAHAVLAPLALPLPEDVAGARSRIVLGVRPEHLRLVGDDTALSHTLPARVQLVEFMGAQSQLVLGTAAGTLVLCMQERAPLHAGQTGLLGFHAAPLHWFDADSGQRLLSQRAGEVVR